MKREFSAVKSILNSNSVYFLYGNYKKAFYIFCDFIASKLDLIPEYYSISDFLTSNHFQASLFEEKKKCICIKNIEDKDLKKIEPFLDDPSKIFVMESGDFLKSKIVVDYFVKSEKYIAIASFKNDFTLISLLKMLFPNCSRDEINQIINLINNTDEELFSFFTKIGLLLEESPEDLKNYFVFKEEFIDELEPISFLRYVSSMLLKYKLYDKNFNKLKLDFNKPGLMKKIIETEIKYKKGIITNKFEIELDR